MSRVADRYRPVDRTVRRRDPSGRVILGMFGVALLLLLFSAADVRGFVSQREGLVGHDALLAVTGGVEAVSRGIGLAALRAELEAKIAEGLPTERVGVAPEPEVPPAPPPEPPPRPGEGWTGPADPGGERVRSVLIVGASSIQYYLGGELERSLQAQYPGVEVHRLGKLGTGLVRDDVFDWPAELHRLQEEHAPDVVVCQFGGNDAQAWLSGGRIAFGKPGWDEAYRARLVEVMQQIRDDGATPVFVGMPKMRDDGFSGRIARVNRVTREAAAQTGAHFVPTWDFTTTPRGAYQVEVTFEGRRGRMRMSDGIHYSRLGARYAAHHLVMRLEQHVPLVPGDETLAVALHRRIDSAARRKVVPYLAYVPRQPPPEGLPVLVLLHGAWDSWTAWADHAHRELQRLATAHRLILVLPDGEPFGWYLDSQRVLDNQIATHLVHEVIPDVREHLPATDRLGLMGLSMGGHGAIVTAMRSPGLAVSVSSMSGAVDLSAARDRESLQALLGPYDEDPAAWHAWSARHRLLADPATARALALRLHTGASDASWTAPNRRLHEELTRAGIPHVWEEVPGGHVWEVWTAALPAHVAWHAQALHAD